MDLLHGRISTGQDALAQLTRLPAAGRTLAAQLSCEDLRALRGVSRHFKDWIDSDQLSKSILFQTLYVSRINSDRQAAFAALENIGTYCTQLVVRFEQTEGNSHPPARTQTSTYRAPASSAAAGPQANFQPWNLILRYLPNLIAIAMSTSRGPHWGSLTQLEMEMVSFRIALENAWVPSLRILRVEPVHAFGVNALRWDSPNALGASSWAAPTLWGRITTLEVQVTNPFETLADNQSQVFQTALYEWLASFKARLRVLKFHWVGQAGPSPLVFTTQNRPEPPEWDFLEEIWLGNVDIHASEGEEPVILIKDRIREVRKIMLLRDPGAYQVPPMPLVNFDRESEWVDRTEEIKALIRLREEYEGQRRPWSGNHVTLPGHPPFPFSSSHTIPIVVGASDRRRQNSEGIEHDEHAGHAEHAEPPDFIFDEQFDD